MTTLVEADVDQQDKREGNQATEDTGRKRCDREQISPLEEMLEPLRNASVVEYDGLRSPCYDKLQSYGISAEPTSNCRPLGKAHFKLQASKFCR